MILTCNDITLEYRNGVYWQVDRGLAKRQVRNLHCRQEFIKGIVYTVLTLLALYGLLS